MKRFLFVVLSLLFAFSLLVLRTVNAFNIYRVFFEDGFNEEALQNLALGIIYLIGAIITFAACLVVVFSRYKVLTPIYEKLKEKRENKRAARKAKQLSDKQKKLEQLQAELDELKKD